MKTIEDQMSVYAAYHQDTRNKATHFIGVPAITLSLMIPPAWIRLDAGGVTISAAMLLAAALLIYYILLDAPLGLAMVPLFGVGVFVAQKIADLGAVQGWIWFGILFVGGWILQLVGHVFEGRKPALADNLFQALMAPIFLLAEVFFALGYKPDLLRRLNEKAQFNRAQSAESSKSLPRTSSRSGASGSRSA
jgi:uncharacterized membrane protein YGL010W